jgi:hypothetical protein
MPGIWGEESTPEPIEETTSPEPNVDEEPEASSAPTGDDESNESSETLTAQEQPLLAGKYKDRWALIKGIVNKAAMLLQDGKLDEMPSFRKDATDEELEAMYKTLGKKPRGQVAPPSAPTAEIESEAEEDEDETDETPPTEDFATAVAELQEMVKFAQSGDEPVVQPIPQVQVETPTFDEPEVDVTPIADEMKADFIAQGYDEEVAQGIVNVFVRGMQKYVQAEAARQGKILGLGLQPFIASVSRREATDSFNREFKAYAKDHPDHVGLKDLMRDVWLHFPKLHGIKGGKDAWGGKTLSGIERAALMAAQYQKVQTHKATPKPGLRVASAPAKPRTSKPEDIDTVTRRQIVTPLSGGIWGD